VFVLQAEKDEIPPTAVTVRSRQATLCEWNFCCTKHAHTPTSHFIERPGFMKLNNPFATKNVTAHLHKTIWVAWKPTVHCHIHSSSPPFSTLSHQIWLIPAHDTSFTLISCLNSHVNLLLANTLLPPRLSNNVLYPPAFPPCKLHFLPIPLYLIVLP
jgi:hypothetical protein